MHRPTNNYHAIDNSTMEKILSRSHIPWVDRNEKNDNNDSFLQILHKLIDQSDDTKIISWTTDGLSFCVHDFRRFEHYIIPIYFCNHFHPNPLANYDSFLKRLQSYSFLRKSNEGDIKDNFRHPLFVRGEKHLLQQMTCHKPKYLSFQWQDHCPMPSFSKSVEAPSKCSKEARRSVNARRPRPCPTSISSRKKKKISLQKRNYRYHTHHSSKDIPIRPIDTACRGKKEQSERQSEHRKKNNLSFLELLRDISFCGDNANDDINEDYEPLSISTCCNMAFDIIDLTNEDDTTIPPSPDVFPTSNNPTIDDVQPLDPLSHKDDGSLDGDITKALARI